MQASLGAVSMFRNPHTGPDTVSGPVENFCATFVLLLPGRPTVGHPVDNTFLCYFCATFCTSFAPHLNHLQPPFILRRKNVNYEHFVPKEPCIYQAMFCCKWHFGAFHDELLTILCRALFCLAMSHNTNLGGSIFRERIRCILQ